MNYWKLTTAILLLIAGIFTAMSDHSYLALIYGFLVGSNLTQAIFEYDYKKSLPTPKPKKVKLTPMMGLAAQIEQDMYNPKKKKKK